MHAMDDRYATEPRHFDVAIVGYGPVGATLAGLLGRLGLSVGVFERTRGIFAQPRAVGFDHDAMRLFQRIGVADALAPFVERFRDTVYCGVDGQVIQRVQPVAPPYPLTWAPNYTCDQPGLESVLRAAVQRMDTVHVALGQELLRADAEPGRLSLELRLDSGALQRHTASWLVGCDGASSTVRRLAGIALDSMDYDEPWIVVDARVDDAHLPSLPATNVQYCEPARPSTYIVCPGNHRRWEFMLLDGEPRDGVLEEARLWQLLSRWLHPGQGRIWRAAAYRFHALVARDWRAGRMLLAGDSAHQTPPFLGQGMCQGLRDAGNLAWKLEAVVRGTAPGDLLDSYTAERKPHVNQTTRIARALGQMMSERDVGRARARDAEMCPGCTARTVVRQDLIPGLQAGLLAPWAARAGAVFPQPVVHDLTGQELLLDDVAAPCFRVVVGDTLNGDALQALVVLARTHALPVQRVAAQAACTAPVAGATVLHERDGLLRRWFADASCRGALVRPDHYVYGAFDTLEQAARLFAEFRRQLPQHRFSTHPRRVDKLAA